MSEGRSRFVRRKPQDPVTRLDESLAFVASEDSWRPPPWFSNIAVVLVEPTDAVNIGGVVRVMANTGFLELRLVKPAKFNPWDVGGIAHYTQHIVSATEVFETLPAAVADRQFVLGLTGRHHRVERNALAFPDAVYAIAEAATEGQRVAVVFGREDSGLSNAMLDVCHAVTTIPTNPAYPSLNLAQAALLTLYQLFQRSGGMAQTYRPPRHTADRASGALLEDLFSDMERALDAIEFLKSRSRVSTLRSLRVALYRASLDTREASLLRALFIEVRKYLKRKGVLADLGPIGKRQNVTLSAVTQTRNAVLPERAELLAGVWRLPLPLRDSPLGHVNTYLVRADDGYLLVDCGWDTADTLQALEGHLRALDIPIGDVRHLVITHIHPDHYGLAGRLREMSKADLSFHRLERLYIESRYGDAEDLLAEMHEWLRINGTPAAELDKLNFGSMGMLERVSIAFPDRTLDGGEEITCGRFAFRVLWTPGHSTGHICLYDARHKILLSGDHVLPHITPSVGLHVRAASNPLADYLDSLRLIGKLEAELVMPGHGEPFHGLPERTGELLAHHQRRLDEIVSLLGQAAGQSLTGYEIAARMQWSRRRTWDDLSGFERRLAVTEALAHIELLHARGQVQKSYEDGRITYCLPEGSTAAVHARQ